MATITAKINGINGESTIQNHTDEVEAIGVRESVVSSDAAPDGNRSVEIELIRHRDTASAKLAQNCAAGTNLGNVNIYMLNDDGETFMEYALTNAYVKQIQHGTLDQSNIGHQPGGLAGSPQGLALVGGFTNLEIERVLLNVGTVTWTYSPPSTSGINGSTSKSFDLTQGTSS